MHSLIICRAQLTVYCSLSLLDYLIKIWAMRFNLKNLKQSHQSTYFIIDLIMIGLVTFNLTWLIFDWLFISDAFRGALYWLTPGFAEFYGNNIHPNFISYDLIFVAIYLTEFSLRWIAAIVNKTYHRWFFYPFVHWYDVLGCIPVGSFRWLRLLRIISIGYRLQKYGIVDFTNTALGRFVTKYYNVLVEEVSDRVVVNVLDGVEDELKQGSPVVEKIMREVLIPHKGEVADWLTEKINEVCEEVYLPKQQQFQHYIDQRVADSISKDPKVAALETVPVLGPKITDQIESTVSEVVFDIVNQLIIDLGEQKTDQIVQPILESIIQRVLEPSDELGITTKAIVIETLQIVKDEVRVKRWQESEALAQR